MGGDLEQMESSIGISTVLQATGLRVSMAQRVKEADTDGGRISVNELVDIVEKENDAQKDKKLLKKMATIMAVLLIFTLAATVGLTAAVIYFAKDTDVKDDGMMTVKGTDTAVKISSGDYAIGSKSALKTPGSRDEDPDIIGTAPVIQKYDLVDTLSVLDPTYSGCPTYEFTKCYEEVIATALASIKTVTLPGSDDSIEGMTVYNVASATLQNGTVKIETHLGKTLFIERIPGDIQISLEDPNAPGTRRLLATATATSTVVSSAATSGSSYTASTTPPAATPDSADEKLSCKDSFSCIFSSLDLANTQKKDSSFKLVVGKNKDGSEIDLFSYFSPSAFVKALASLTGKAICDLTFYGSQLQNAKVDMGFLSSSSFIDDAASFINLYSELPTDDNTRYMVGMFATGIPGLTDFLLPAIQIVTAFNPCSGDYLFAFNGVEIEIPVKLITGTIGLSTFGYSTGKKISSEKLFSEDANEVVWKPWSPTGYKTTTFSGNVMLKVYGSLEVGLSKAVAIGFEVDASFVLNSDPKGNGNAGENAQDFQLLVKLKGGPYFSLLDGKLKFDFKDHVSITGLLHAEWWDTSRYTFAAQLSVKLKPGDFFKAIPLVPKIVGDVINAMMPFTLNTIDFYIDQSDWGARVILGVGSVDGNPLKFLDDIVPGLDLYSDFLKYIPGVSSIPALKGGFGLSGKMTGNGMPVKVNLYDSKDTAYGFYFCGSSSDCPSGFSCYGICAKIACRAGLEMHGLLCYDPCPAGWKHILGVCYEPCKSGYTDGGLLCTDWAGNCDAGQEKDAGLCYPRCQSGYYGVGPVCWSYCGSGYTDIGALCHRGTADYGKSCCHWGTTSCGSRKWGVCWWYNWGWKNCGGCASGYTDMGCTCHRPLSSLTKSTYGRGVGTAAIDTYSKASKWLTPYPLSISTPA